MSSGPFRRYKSSKASGSRDEAPAAAPARPAKSSSLASVQTNWDDIETEILSDFEEVDDFVRCRWFHKAATRQSAEQLLLPAANFSFLVRPSSQAGSYALSMKDANGQIIHAAIQGSQGDYFLTGAPDHYPSAMNKHMSRSYSTSPLAAQAAAGAARGNKVGNSAAATAAATATAAGNGATSGTTAAPARTERHSTFSATARTGWLELVKGRQRQPLWFVIEDGTLSWFTGEVGKFDECLQSMQRGQLVLAKCSVSQPQPSGDGYHQLSVCGPNGNEALRLGNHSSFTLAAWARELRKVIAGGGGSATAGAPQQQQGQQQQSSSRPVPTAVVHRGKLVKKGKSRYFVVACGYLMWFATPSVRDLRECKGTFSMLGAAIREDGDVVHVTNAVGVPYDLKASSPSEAGQWFRALCGARSEIEWASESGASVEGPASAVARSGWLEKKGKRRWFSLQGDVLMWFTEQIAAGTKGLASKCTGHIALANCVAMMMSDLLAGSGGGGGAGGDGGGGGGGDGGGSRLVRAASDASQLRQSIVVNTPFGRSYVLAAASAAEATEWLRALRRAISQANSKSVTSTLFAPLVAPAGGGQYAASGWLTRGRKRHFYALTEEILAWFDRVEDAESLTNMRNSLVLSGCSVRADGDTAIAIYTPQGDRRVFEAPSADERTRWLAALESQISAANRAVQTKLASTEEALAANDVNGWLRKSRKNFWCEVHNQTLLMYTGEKGRDKVSRLAGGIDLGGCSVDMLRNPANSFAISTSLGRYELFTARTAAECTYWFESLERIIGHSARQLVADRELAQRHADDIVSVLFDYDCGLLRTLLRAYSSDELVKVVLSLAMAQGRAIELLDIMMCSELDASISVGTLFRGDSPTTKLTREFMRFTASDFLEAAIGAHVRSIANHPHKFEVDPSKLDAGERLDENIRNLDQTVQVVLNNIVAAESRLPADIYLFFANVREAVDVLFPEQYAKVAAGFVFLRFVCPALFSPVFFGLLEEPPEGKSQRALILVAKVLQNLANDVTFGKKEEYLVPLNAFIERNRGVMQSFLHRLASTERATSNNARRALVGGHADERFSWMTAISRILASQYHLIERQCERETELHFEILGQLLRFAHIAKIRTK